MSSTLISCPAPAPSDRGPSFPIARCNALQRFQLRFTCLSDDVFGLKVHFAGKSNVCLAPAFPCEFCKDEKPWRWVGYLAAADALCHKQFLVELTAGVMPDVNRYRELWPTLRGREITLSRPSMKPTGRLKIDFGSEARTAPSSKIPPPFNVIAVLEKIYGVTKPEKTHDGTPFDHSTVAAGNTATEEMSSLSCRQSVVQDLADRLGVDAESNGQHVG